MRREWLNRDWLKLTASALLIAMLAGCDSPEQANSGQYVALLMHPASLPAHRHMDELDTIQRQFLATLSPGDRLIFGDDRLNQDHGKLREISLSDRPLQSTREKRVLNRVLATPAGGQEMFLGDRLEEIATRMNDSRQRPRCLYLVINPSRQRPPIMEEELWQGEQALGGWTAFMIIPNPDEQDFRDREDWLEHLHRRGAGRIQVSGMNDPLPSCRE